MNRDYLNTETGRIAKGFRDELVHIIRRAPCFYFIKKA